jgi:pimeloyl-ACP methyl ester carboxylesterase
LPADRTAVFGVSASAELALTMGLRHPDIYGAVFCASPGAGYRPPAVLPGWPRDDRGRRARVSRQYTMVTTMCG